MAEIDLKKVIHKDLMIIPSKSKNKAEVIKELGSLLSSNGYVNDAQEFINDVYLREAEGVTGIGQGVAIPHGKSPSVKDTTIAIAVLENEIEWETLDSEPVKVVIMFAVKDIDATTTHILLLQQVAQLLAHDDFLKELVQVTNVDNLYQLLTKND
ncbi:PTS sugar transporter subunit IIA [Lactococcus lactis]|uniref:PTS sugar transporter subunit IIA n=1 Tax=Lactococcus lactis TaxID=1358 RepID=UPI0026598200|nr:fructose PTS transporter subunit IIA [Lactococcus lactis]WKG35658.1 fructose PTS transporter subunit IIA [Lactococcus lactis subsp. lactis]WNN67653.1 fructose PTS transporter subunit IIA [Lactococcus lactis]WPK09600.1 fructose PTS transporter subunit IIA [Lactococcus lactis]